MTANPNSIAGELRIVLAGGGTGGHLYPAIAIAQAFARRHENCKLLFIGTERGLENRVVRSLGYRLELVPVRGLLRKFTLSNLLVPLRLLQSVVKCSRLFREFDPHLIIGTGGYVSGPALLAAWLSHRKFAVQEQNSYPGLVNRWVGRFAHAVFLSFEESRKYFKRQDRIHVVGNPVRRGLAARSAEARAAAADKWNLDVDRTTLLVFGGSQGARAINDAIAEILPDLARIEGLQLLWATGPAHFEKLSQRVAPYEFARVVSYIEDMNLAYALADFVVSRSGASTIFELLFCGLPSILIPFPFATADHQRFNAKTLADAGAARVIDERELDKKKLFEGICSLATDTTLRGTMAAAARSLAKPRAAEDIVDVCLELGKGE